MVIAARVSQHMRLIRADEVARIETLLERARLPIAAPDLGLARYMQLMGTDKKVEGGKIRFILLRGIGSAFLTADVPHSALAAALTASVKHD
jgi:3-dehydroquinate synthase